MKCPYCGNNEDKVMDKRNAEDINVTRRRRECLKCGKRFTTHERIENLDTVVIKKDGTREKFDRDKVKRGIMRACEKRPISMDQIDKAVDEIEAEVRSQESNEIASKLIGELIMKKLKSLDKVAYIRFASVYREFTDVGDFKKEVNELMKKQ